MAFALYNQTICYDCYGHGKVITKRGKYRLRTFLIFAWEEQVEPPTYATCGSCNGTGKTERVISVRSLDADSLK